MKKTTVILMILFAISRGVFAQTSNDVGKIALSVVMPEDAEELTNAQLKKIETKIAQIVMASGLAASGYATNFVVYPKFAINETNVVEGGMQNITLITAELNLFIKQVDNNIMFSSVSKSLKGSGSTKELAITNAIGKILANDPEFKNFIDNGKDKILSYYESKCDDIISKSDALAKMQKFEEALGLLLSIPQEVAACYGKSQSKSITVYKAYQTQICADLLQKSKISLATNDYGTALNFIAEIDPSATCFKEGQILAKTIEDKVTAEEKKQWDFQMKQYNDGVGMEKLRINAIKDIVVSYYKSKPKTVNYNYIIR